VVGCEPCIENLYLGNASLVDVTPTAPLLKVQKALSSAGRINDADQFLVAIRNASTSVALNSASTSGAGSTVTGGLASITGDTTTTYKVTEEMATGSKSKLAQYDAALSCSNANSSGTQFAAGSIQVGQNFPLLKAGDDVTCTLTNTPKAPVLRLTKALGTGGRANNADQFIVAIQQRLSNVQTGTTSGTGSTIVDGTTGWVTLTRDLAYTLNETMKPNSVSLLSQYASEVRCDNALTGSPTAVSLVPGTAFTPVPGDVLDCRITNTPLPATVQVSQRLVVAAPYTFKGPVTFTHSGNNGWVDQPIKVLKDNQVTPGARQTLTRNTETTLSVTPISANWSVVNNRCTDSNYQKSGNPATLVSNALNSITIPAAYMRAGAVITCAMLQSYKG
jgi:hypothetical protein